MASELLRSLVPPSDTLVCILDVESETTPRTDTPRKYALAVVTHPDQDSESDVGSLLVLDASATSGVVRVVDALSITEHLTLEVAQTGPVNAQTEDSEPAAPTEAWSAWRLTIRRDVQDTSPYTFVVRTRRTQKLQTLAAECRRLKEIASATSSVTTDFSWVAAYFVDPSSHRLDLRLRRQALNTRLSTAVAGLPGDDPSDISIVRRDWIEQTAVKRASSDDVKHLKIRLGTFNVNGRTPSQDLHPWLRGSESQRLEKPAWISPLKLSPFEVSSDLLHQDAYTRITSTGASDLQAFGDPDLLVLGFQELNRSTEALLYATNTLEEDEWLAAIFAGLGEKCALYEKLVSRQLVGMLLIVIVKKSLIPYFTDIRSSDAGSGIMGFMGNKGATAIRLKFTPTIASYSPIKACRSAVLTFINAHLAASDDMVERRNHDFNDLSGRLVFLPEEIDESYPPPSLSKDSYNIYQTDVLFWMGGEIFQCRIEDGLMIDLDLNYRLDLSDGDIRKLLSLHASGVDSIQTLLSHDQLGAAIRSNRAFPDFREQPITYMPTYRLMLGLSKERMRYDMRRKPAWTDRVLYMTSPDMKVAQVAYRSHPGITMSDHQPVSADFDISLTLTDQLRYENTVSALHLELAGFEDSERRPKINIRPTSIELGSVKYKQTIHREVVLRNDGDIPCVFRFVGTGNDPEPISPSWLRVEPLVGLLRPGDTTTISLSVYVDNNSAAKLNLSSSTFGCTLILHTVLGKDDFITVSGHYQYTCFANTVERLTRLGGPIRKLASPEDVMPAERAISAPREIMRLINWMMAHVSATDAPFECPAQERSCQVIRECLDTGDEFPSEPDGPDGDHPTFVAAFASTLIALLDSLIEPVVPARLHARCLQARDKDEGFELLNAFPHESINVWISLTAFLHYVAKQGESEDASLGQASKAQRLASIFAPVLLRDDSTGVYPRASPVGKCDFLLLFID